MKKTSSGDEVIFDDGNDNENKVKDTLKEAVPVEREEIKEEVKKNMGIPKYDTKTGLFNLDGVEDGELKAVLKLANDTVKANNNNALITSAINAKVDSIQLAKGISKDVVLAVLDKNLIKVTDGAVQGVDEAFAKLQNDNSGLFAAKAETKSNPILEGFNPMQSSSTRIPNSFAEAYAMEMGEV